MVVRTFIKIFLGHLPFVCQPVNTKHIDEPDEESNHGTKTNETLKFIERKHYYDLFSCRLPRSIGVYFYFSENTLEAFLYRNPLFRDLGEYYLINDFFLFVK